MNRSVWKPSLERSNGSKMHQFIKWLDQHRGLHFANSYDELYQWSVTDLSDFWGALAEYLDIQFKQRGSVILDNAPMPNTQWFKGYTLNFAEHLLRYFVEHPKAIAIVAIDETGDRQEISGETLVQNVSSVATYLKKCGVKPEDRVAAYVSNTPEAIIAMLATTSLGAIWSSCSPDFGVQGVIDRFSQIEPKVLFAVNGYYYNGKAFDRRHEVEAISKELKSLQTKVGIHRLKNLQFDDAEWTTWESTIQNPASLYFEPFNFQHPIYILYSSGTTGSPKCIVHGAGGTLLQHMKELKLHTDLGHDDRLLYYTTTGWMMWNWMVSALSLGTTLVLYEGSPSYPDLSRLWEIVRHEKVTVFGTSAKFIGSCRSQTHFETLDLPIDQLKTVLSTGSPLLPEDFDWFYKHFGNDVMLSSISGGTDIVSCFLLGNPMLPVYRGEIQCRGLGMSVKIFSNDGEELIGEQGELVCTKPAPSMPLYFWNDPQGEKYRNAYFNVFDGIWRHGDYALINEHGGAVIFGRSDATLNPGGVRIGTAEIYRQVDTMEDVVDSLVVGQQKNGDVRILLFVVLKSERHLDESLISKIKERIKKNASPRHVPHDIYQIQDIPYTVSGKKVEIAVAKILRGETIYNREALKNPESLDQFKAFVNAS
ncbi:MAG: acetoacetate--CoA ligase [Bdellovibrionales bacterium]|nr:acetoacetate--CoA ligase [Bdellovibrionales bacterium]